MSKDHHLGIFDTPPGRRQTRLALAIVGVLVLATLLILPVRNVRLVQVDAFVPMVDTLMFIGEVITATMLYAQASVFRSRALAVLAAGYLGTALIIVPHALTFPGAFTPDGLLGAGINTAAWVATLRRVALSIAVLFYVWLKRADTTAEPGADRTTAWIVGGAIAAVALAAAITLLVTAGHDLLPPYYASRLDMIRSRAALYEVGVFALFALATVALLRSRTSVLDLWLLVSFACWLIQSGLIALLHARFTAGFYLLYAMMTFAHLVVMVALIAESNRLYARLAMATAANDRERESRLMAVDAVASAIAHEVGQPLAAVGANARASLNWLSRDEPNVERATKSVQATMDASQRASDAILAVRAIFAKRSERATEFSLTELVRETAVLLHQELAAKKVLLELAPDEALPPIRADRVQIQLVLINLLTNAIESLGATQGRPRGIAIRSAPLAGQGVLLEVRDNGVGMTPQEMSQAFETFFTTKPTGTGLGLSLCRNIVERHGGRLWASQDQEHGATFHMQLPAARGSGRRDKGEPLGLELA